MHFRVALGLCEANVSVKSKLQHPPPGMPRAFDTFAVPGGGNLIIRVFQGVGNLIPML